MPAISTSQASVSIASQDRKSTRLNSSHSQISYAVFCLKKKNRRTPTVSANLLAMADPQPIILLDRVTKIYRMGDVEVHALRGISLSLEDVEFVAIMGSS